jgi:hypothetical protein
MYECCILWLEQKERKKNNRLESQTQRPDKNNDEPFFI